MIVVIDVTTLRIQHGRRGRIDEGRALSRFGDASRRRLAEIDYGDQRRTARAESVGQQRVIEHEDGTRRFIAIVADLSKPFARAPQVTSGRKSRAP